jgi:CrcB protein
LAAVQAVSAGGCLQRWVTFQFPYSFPWGTLGVNIIGCGMIGIFWGLSFKGFENNESWKLFLMTGLCGGFTTFLLLPWKESA